MGRKDPEYITPLVKYLLRQRNKFQHKGRIAEADQLAIKINKLITDKRQRMLNKLTFAGTRELWAAVKKPLFLPVCLTMTFSLTQRKLMITLLAYAPPTLIILMR